MNRLKGLKASLLLMCCFQFIPESENLTDNLIFIILSQPNPYNENLAQQLKQSLIEQINPSISSQILISSMEEPGDWTILPLLEKIVKLQPFEDTYWLFFCVDYTNINVKLLLKALDKYTVTKEVFIGHGLVDREATIIHHFAFFNDTTVFKYPNIASGFVMSSILAMKTIDRLKKMKESETEFSIDAAYELALYLWNNGDGVPLHHESCFCTKKREFCASYPRLFEPCSKPVPIESIYFAVKTCDKFHETRIKVVHETWAPLATNIYFFSNVQDDTIPTINLGIPNTEYGHCGKTIAILKYINKSIIDSSHIQWIVITDDDTILSVTRLQEYLSCFNSSTPVVLGERYGYNVVHNKGYNYISGGGGIVLSRPLLKLLTNPNACECPSISTPDDMFLGICLARMGISITHSPLFHQARPDDYSIGYLESHGAISFHKHWMLDPIHVYKKWFDKANSLNASKALKMHDEF